MSESNDLNIGAYLHCGECLKERPDDITPQDWGSLEVGWTEVGLQVWCKRHKCNVLHIDFEGAKHPADITRLPFDQPPPKLKAV